MWNFIATRNSTVFTYNSWFITLFNNDSTKNNEMYLRTRISTMKSLTLNARIYFLVINYYTTITENGSLFEAYRIGENSELLISEIGQYFNGQFQALTKEFIWERRKNLYGHEFKVVALQNPPFLILNNTVIIQNTNFILNNITNLLILRRLYVMKTDGNQAQNEQFQQKNPPAKNERSTSKFEMMETLSWE